MEKDPLATWIVQCAIDLVPHTYWNANLQPYLNAERRRPTSNTSPSRRDLTAANRRPWKWNDNTANCSGERSNHPSIPVTTECSTRGHHHHNGQPSTNDCHTDGSSATVGPKPGFGRVGSFNTKDWSRLLTVFFISCNCATLLHSVWYGLDSNIYLWKLFCFIGFLDSTWNSLKIIGGPLSDESGIDNSQLNQHFSAISQGVPSFILSDSYTIFRQGSKNRRIGVFVWILD